MAMRSRSLSEEEHFARGYTGHPNGCWLWVGQPKARYPSFWFRGKAIRVHRVSWEIHRGEIPVGIRVCHNCPEGDNTRCVNPAHLFLGTQADNLQDMASKGRHGAQRDPDAFTARLFLNRRSLPGAKNPAARLSEAQVVQLRCLRRDGASYGVLMKRFGMSKSQVARICNYDSWSKPTLNHADEVLLNESSL